jgi:hypothetical protein
MVETTAFSMLLTGAARDLMRCLHIRFGCNKKGCRRAAQELRNCILSQCSSAQSGCPHVAA